MTPNPHGIKMPRAQRSVMVRSLKHEAGMTFDQIAAALGVSKTTVTSAYYDPTGADDRKRRQKYKGECIDCGATTAYQDASGPALRCQLCRREYQRSDEFRATLADRQYEQRWSDADLLDALVRASEDGVISTSIYDRAYEQAKRGSMPSRARIVQRFDKWTIAAEKAGLKTVARAKARERVTAEGCLLAIEGCAAELGRMPSCSEYRRWARDNGAPSAELVRVRCGTWLDAVSEASDRIASQEPIAA